MKKKYSHITKTERLEISVLKKKGYSIRDIAGALKRSPGTISDEMRRNNTKRQYDPEKADHKAYVRRKYSKYQGMKIIQRNELRDYVETKLKDDWSPEEISGRLERIDRHLPYASFRVIYKFVSSTYGVPFIKHLRYKGTKRKSGNRIPVTKIGGRTFIDQRPKIVENRRRFGDWEGDFIVSRRAGKGVLLVLHERKARFVLLHRILNPTIAEVHRIMAEMTGGVIVNTLTLDNDIVFRKHEELSRILGVPVYFCHPYHSWEKGGVENSNKLIRQYIPKGSDISRYEDAYIQLIQDKLNNRPRKCLKYKTPLEMMTAHQQLKNEVYAMLNMIFVEQNKTAECSA